MTLPTSLNASTNTSGSAPPICAGPWPSKDEALALYRRLVLAREAEEAIRREYANDEMKTPVHLGIGQEAIPVGVLHAAPPGTLTFGTYRNHVLYLTVTGETDGFFAELYGRVTGPGKGKAGSMHLASPEQGLIATSAVVGTTIPLAVGAALAQAYQGTGRLVAVFFGEGAIEEGVFWESLNFAALKRLRVLFVCEDNDLAIHTPTRARQGFRSIPEAVRGFRCQVASGDGTDVVSVIQLTRQVLERMNRDGGPGLLHLTYFRALEHVGPREDFAAGYRRTPSPEEFERLDPVRRFETLLPELGCSRDEVAEVRHDVAQQIARSLERARAAAFPSADELRRDAWA
jgi:pyruvate dehydrogenase E1 component alpha subunit